MTLDRPEIPERIAYARTPRTLPSILSADEVIRFLEAVSSLESRAALTTAYAAGLRASGASSLKVTALHSSRRLISAKVRAFLDVLAKPDVLRGWEQAAL